MPHSFTFSLNKIEIYTQDLKIYFSVTKIPDKNMGLLQPAWQVRLVFLVSFYGTRERNTRRDWFFPPLVRVRMRILEISPSYLVLGIRDPYGQQPAWPALKGEGEGGICFCSRACPNSPFPFPFQRRPRRLYGQRMTKGTPGDEVAMPYKKQRLLRRIGLL